MCPASIHELTSTQVWAKMLDEKLNLTTLSLNPHLYKTRPKKIRKISRFSP